MNPSLWRVFKKTTNCHSLFLCNYHFHVKFHPWKTYFLFHNGKSHSDLILVENISLCINIFLFHEGNKSSKCDICSKYSLEDILSYLKKVTRHSNVIFVENVIFTKHISFFIVENNSLFMHIFLFHERNKSSRCDICGKW